VRFVMKRGHEGWVWPKTILDFATSSDGGIDLDELDRIMDATSELFGGREVGVTIQTRMSHGRESQVLLFEVRHPHAGSEQRSALAAAWSQAFRDVVDNDFFHHAEVSILPGPDETDDQET